MIVTGNATPMTTGEARETGRRAAIDGLSRESNPFDAATLGHCEWLKGFDSAVPYEYGKPSDMEEEMRRENEDLPYCDRAR